MKHYEVRNEDTGTERPPQTLLFVGPRDPPFLSSVRRTARRRRRSGRGCAPGRSQILVRMCRGGIYNFCNPGCFGDAVSLGVSTAPEEFAVPCSSPSGQSCRLWQGRNEAAGSLLPMRRCLAQLAPCRHLGLRKGFCYQPSLAQPLDPFPRPGRSREA